MPERLGVLLLVAIMAALVSCGGSSVGSEKLFNGLKSSPNSRLGTDPTPSPSLTPAAQNTPPPATNAPPPSQKPAAQHFAIGVYSDTSGKPQYDPPAARVFAGTVIDFVNHDTVARSVVESDHTPPSFDSHPIAPSGVWSFTTSAKGTFNYHDGTRPYAVAYFQVL